MKQGSWLLVFDIDCRCMDVLQGSIDFQPVQERHSIKPEALEYLVPPECGEDQSHSSDFFPILIALCTFHAMSHNLQMQFADSIEFGPVVREGPRRGGHFSLNPTNVITDCEMGL